MEYITRNKVLENSVFASFVAGWQQMAYPTDSIERKEGNHYDEEKEIYRFYSQQELNEFIEIELEEFTDITDGLKQGNISLKGNIVLEAPNDVEEIPYLAAIIVLFLKEHAQQLTFMPLFNKPWFHDDINHHHLTTKKAYAKLKKIINNDDYHGAVSFTNPSELEKMLIPYFELVQGNYYGYDFFYASHLNTVLSFHYSGEIWFYIYSPESERIVKSFIKKHNLQVSLKYPK
jgi:hypothetical protein